METIKIKYRYWYKGARLTQTKEWDDHYGLNDRDSHKFGVYIDGVMTTGQAAYDYLTTAILEDGKTFLELLPVWVGLVPEIPNPEWAYGEGKPRWIPNPGYPAQLEHNRLADEAMIVLMHFKIQLVCRVTFPTIPCTGDRLEWWKWADGWQPIPVDPTLYRGGRKIVNIMDSHDPMYGAFLNYVRTRKADKDAMLKTLLRIK